MSAHTQASVLAEFEEVALEPNESFPHGIRKFNRYACAQACADARNERDELRGALQDVDVILTVPAAEYVPAIRDAFVRITAALLAAGFTERAT